MNLYLVMRKDEIGYDEFDAFVCVADNEQCAKDIHPMLSDTWEESTGWIVESDKHLLNVIYVGEADEHLKSGDIVLTSFNAG